MCPFWFLDPRFHPWNAHFCWLNAQISHWWSHYIHETSHFLANHGGCLWTGEKWGRDALDALDPSEPSSLPMSRSQWVSVARTIPKFTASAAAVEPWPVPMSRAVLKAKRSDRKRSTMSSTVEDLPPQKMADFSCPTKNCGFDSQQFGGLPQKSSKVWQ